MKKRYFKYGGAYIRVTALGGFTENMINEMISHDIQIYEIEQTDTFLEMVIKPYDYPFVRKTAKKYGIKMRVSERHGLYFKLYPYRKRWGLILGALCCCAVIAVLSQFVWDIRITGNETVTDAEISRVMEKNGLLPGCWKFSFDSGVCELSAMTELNKLSWISVEKVGSTVYITVAETENAKQEEISVDTPCNIIADYEGQLSYSIVHKGVLQTQVGSAVKKGQLLVSGTVNDNGGNIVYVHADGEFRIICDQTEEFYLPFVQEKTVPTDVKHYSTYLMFGSYALPLFWSSYNPADMEGLSYTENTYTIYIFGQPTPYRYKTGVFTETETQTVTYTAKDVVNQLEKQKSDFEDNFLSECKIISSEKKYETTEDGVKLTVKYKVERTAGIKQPINIVY